MHNIDLIELGSKTAKNGFANEIDVINIFNDWKNNKIAQDWLSAMNYCIDNIEYVSASKIKGSYKADIQVKIRIVIKIKSQEDLQNLQVKLVSNKQGFNQIDKRWVDKYAELWNMPENIITILKSQNELISFFESNRILIISDLLKGRGEFSADWTLVILKVENTFNWCLKSINHVMNIFGSGEIKITNQGSLKIGKITMQRKGGDNGRKTANMLQFKINPVELF
jgi:hypothetical protein